MQYFNVFFLVFLLLISNITSAIDSVVYPWQDKDKIKENEYYLALLKLALENSKDEFGEYELKKSIQPMYQERSIIEIKNNRNVNVIWTMTSQKREQILSPIRIPIFRGLGGYRVFLIKAGQQEMFSKVVEEEQLKELLAGQGYGWPDSEILVDNGYKLVTGPGHKTLFNMLQHGRFDYMPRSLHEAWNEVNIFKGLQVESSLAIYYPSPYYFFVSNDNPRLKQRIETGLIQAQKNGSFQQLFETHPVTKKMLSTTQFDQRRVFKLKNSFLSKETVQVLEEMQGL